MSTDTTQLAAIRKEYLSASLDEQQVHPNPVEQFRVWMNEALAADLPEPTAMHLATVDTQGRPSGRMVLLKDYGDPGFTFFTNYESRKGLELGSNPHAALTFFWAELERQVRIEGAVVPVDAPESQKYFQSRPRLSQLAAWASPQSRPLAGRGALEALLQAQQAQHPGEDPLPLPPFWGGYRVQHRYLEFWQGRRSRLHDRVVYTLQPGGTWALGRLAP